MTDSDTLKRTDEVKYRLARWVTRNGEDWLWLDSPQWEYYYNTARAGVQAIADIRNRDDPGYFVVEIVTTTTVKRVS
jgi:hypothetical protein